MIKLFESFRKVGSGQAQIEKSLDDDFDCFSDSELADIIRQLSKVGKGRDEILKDVEEMADDSLVGSYIEMVAEDATQIDQVQRHVCWAKMESDEENKDNDVLALANDFMWNALDVDEIAFQLAYGLIKDGEVFFKTYYSEIQEEKEKKEKGENYNEKLVDREGRIFELVQDPSTVKDVMEYGETVGFVVTRNKVASLYPVMDYIHILNDRGCGREKYTFKYTENGKEKEREFTVKYGTSFLRHAREAFNIVKLIEFILLMTRFNRSAFYRIFKVEVGGSTNIEINKIIRRIKNAISKSESVDLKGGKYRALDKNIPYGGNVYIPVKNGKGDINIDSLGGDMDIKGLLDVDYYLNKLFAALRVPKAFLGWDESMSGGIGNESLTKRDANYGKTVKRVVRLTYGGIKQIVDFHLVCEGMEDKIDSYIVDSTQIVTLEETERSQNAIDQTQVASAVKSLVDSFELPYNKEQLYSILMEKVMSIAKLSELEIGEGYESVEG